MFAGQNLLGVFVFKKLLNQVIRFAVHQNAVSVAAMVLTTESLVTEQNLLGKFCC